jgi:Tfp pilus assembly protein PilV
LIEVMIAILLMAIAVVGLVGLYRVQMRASEVSRHTTEATILAQDKMEYLRTQTTLATGNESGLNGLGVANGGIFNRAWVVTPTVTYIDFNVTVSWDESGLTRQVKLVSRRGL